MPKDTKTLGNNKAWACESLGFVHKKRLCQRFDTTSLFSSFRRGHLQTKNKFFQRYISILQLPLFHNTIALMTDRCRLNI